MEPIHPRKFSEFWPFYVCEHADRRNRRLHFTGTLLGMVFLALAFLTGEFWLLSGMPLFGYGLAWFGHFCVEHNRPATLKAPLFSLLGDYKMFVLMCLGRMDAEVERCRNERKK